MSGLEFKIRHPDGRLEELVVDSDRVRIGSGAHCEIRLPADHAAVEHVLVTHVGVVVHVEARMLNVPPTVNGSPFTQTQILPDSILGIGQIQIMIRVVEIVDAFNAIKKKPEQKSPIIYIIGLLAIPLAVFVLFGEQSSEGIGSMPVEVPPLWPAVAASCPQQVRDQALAVARDKQALAEAKRERGPLHIQDSIAAVPLFGTAAACFKLAGAQDLSVQMVAASQRLRTELNNYYRTHQVRLEHVLLIGDLQTAQREVKILRSMLEGQSGPYMIWLSNLDRQLALKFGKMDET